MLKMYKKSKFELTEKFILEMKIETKKIKELLCIISDHFEVYCQKISNILKKFETYKYGNDCNLHDEFYF